MSKTRNSHTVSKRPLEYVQSTTWRQGEDDSQIKATLRGWQKITAAKHSIALQIQSMKDRAADAIEQHRHDPVAVEYACNLRVRVYELEKALGLDVQPPEPVQNVHRHHGADTTTSVTMIQASYPTGCDQCTAIALAALAAGRQDMMLVNHLYAPYVVKVKTTTERLQTGKLAQTHSDEVKRKAVAEVETLWAAARVKRPNAKIGPIQEKVAEKYRVTPRTIGRWRQEFPKKPLDTL